MTWNDILAPAMESPKMKELKAFIKSEREKGVKIYPEGKDIFRAFHLCPYNKMKVVILGQDPYHTPDTADGLCFSTRQDKRPPSLNVIFKEIFRDFNVQYFHNEDITQFFPSNSLENWAKNGFLLLNTILSVKEGEAGSHKDIGWDVLINQVFEGINKRKEPVIFLLWGNYAKAYKPMIAAHHLVFEAPHPASDLYGKSEKKFTGSGHFSLVRDILPTIQGMNLFNTLNLDHCFDKEKAKQVVTQHYPDDAADICNYIDKEMMIHIPVNRDQYWKYIQDFEKSLSTKPII